MGFNKSSYLKIVFGDQARPSAPTHRCCSGYGSSIRGYSTPDWAKALLKEAGRPGHALTSTSQPGGGPGGQPGASGAAWFSHYQP